MAHTVSGELRKAPFIKPGCGQDGQSTMFAVELSEVMKDYQTGEKVYTNYKAVIFAKTQGQIDYYNSVLVEGNFIVVTAEKLKIDVSPCGQYTKLNMENARLENAGYIAANQSQGQNNQAQSGYAPQQQNAPQGGYQPQNAPQQQYQPAPQSAPQQQGGFNPNQANDNIPF